MLANTKAVLDNVECSFDKNGLLIAPAGWVPGTPAPIDPALQAQAEAQTAVAGAKKAQ
jgi:hypothetical protein